MKLVSNVVRLKLPKTAAQALRMRMLARQDEPIKVTITVLPDENRFREQRAWRILFGLYQDCACVRWSKGFKKMPGKPFIGKMRPSKLSLFLAEAMDFVAEERADVHINGERVRRRLWEVLAA